MILRYLFASVVHAAVCLLKRKRSQLAVSEQCLSVKTTYFKLIIHVCTRLLKIKCMQSAVHLAQCCVANQVKHTRPSVFY